MYFGEIRDYRLFLSAVLQMKYAFKAAILQNLFKIDSKDKRIYLEDCKTGLIVERFSQKNPSFVPLRWDIQRKHIRLIRFTDI